MADRYWVGGTGSWTPTNTANWSTTSGGAGGASVPTSADDVFIDPNSNATSYTLTLSGVIGCRSITVLGPASGTLALSGASFTLSIAGSMAIASSGVTRSLSGTINFTATTTGWTINTSGVTLGSVALNFNGVGGGWTLSTALITTAALTFTAGTFNTANLAVTVGSISSTGTASARTVNWGSSLVTLSGNLQLTTNSLLTWNAGTSSFVMAANGPVMATAGRTFYDMTFTSVGFNGNTFDAGTTFNNLTYPSKTSSGAVTITLNGNLTVNGTFTTQAASASNIWITRFLITSATLGTAVTFSAGAVALVDTDFRDITAAGTATWSGTRVGNLGGNTGFTFSAPRTLYVAGGGVSRSLQSNTYATTSGGAVSTANYPLAQDTVIIDDNTVSSGGTVSTNSNATLRFGSLSFSSRTLPMTFAMGSSGFVTLMGDLTFASSVTSSVSSGSIQFIGRGGVQLLTQNGATIGNVFDINNFGGTVRTVGALTTGNNVFHLTGTFDLDNYTLTVFAFYSTSGSTRTFTMGTASIIATGTSGTIFSTNNTAGLTLTGTRNLYATATTGVGTRTFAGGSGTQNQSFNIYITGGADTVSMSGSYNSIDFTGFSGTLANTGRTLFSSLIISPSMTLAAGTGTTFFMGTSMSVQPNGKTFDFPVTLQGSSGGTLTLAGALTLGSTRTFTLTSATLVLAGYTLTTGIFSTSGTLARSITFSGGGSVTLVQGSSTCWNASGSNYTSSGSGTIVCAGATAQTFAGGGFSYPTLVYSGSGGLTISGSNTFTDIQTTVRPITFTFTSGTTQTVNSFSLTGLVGNLVTLRASSAGSRASLSSPSGTISVDYMIISDSSAGGGATWYAGANSSDGGNNAGWIFTAPPGPGPGPSGSGNFFLLMGTG